MPTTPRAAPRSNFSVEDVAGLATTPISAGESVPTFKITVPFRVTASMDKAAVEGGVLVGASGLAASKALPYKLAASYFQATTGGTVFTDDTVDAQDVGAGDVVPFAGVPVANDALYFGGREIFVGIAMVVSTAGTVSNLAHTWEYYGPGGVWTAFSNVNDGTAGSATAPLQAAAGTNIVTWRLPSDWARASISTSGVTTEPALYLARLRITTFTTDYTVEPVIDRIFTIPVAEVVYTGTATGSAATTLTDTGAAWITDQFDGCHVEATSTSGLTVLKVISNTGTVLTGDAWSNGTPTTTSAYTIRSVGRHFPATGVIDLIELSDVQTTSATGVQVMQLLNLSRGTASVFSFASATQVNIGVAESLMIREEFFQTGDRVALQIIGTLPTTKYVNGLFTFYVR